jgi:hypothetical protein
MQITLIFSGYGSGGGDESVSNGSIFPVSHIVCYGSHAHVIKTEFILNEKFNLILFHLHSLG